LLLGCGRFGVPIKRLGDKEQRAKRKCEIKSQEHNLNHIISRHKNRKQPTSVKIIQKSLTKMQNVV
jgi:hypothetical protein